MTFFNENNRPKRGINYAFLKYKDKTIPLIFAWHDCISGLFYFHDPEDRTVDGALVLNKEQVFTKFIGEWEDPTFSEKQMVQPDADGWYEHTPNTWPLHIKPSDEIEILLAGDEGINPYSDFDIATNIDWINAEEDTNLHIIKYRLHKPDHNGGADKMVTENHNPDTTKMVKIDWPQLPKGVWIEWDVNGLLPIDKKIKIKYESGIEEEINRPSDLVKEVWYHSYVFPEYHVVAFMILE
jgi:hypothetical protein